MESESFFQNFRGFLVGDWPEPWGFLDHPAVDVGFAASGAAWTALGRLGRIDLLGPVRFSGPGFLGASTFHSISITLSMNGLSSGGRVSRALMTLPPIRHIGKH